MNLGVRFMNFLVSFGNTNIFNFVQMDHYERNRL